MFSDEDGEVREEKEEGQHWTYTCVHWRLYFRSVNARTDEVLLNEQWKGTIEP